MHFLIYIMGLAHKKVAHKYDWAKDIAHKHQML